jgi:hypothetical protein
MEMNLLAMKFEAAGRSASAAGEWQQLGNTPGGKYRTE